MFLLVCLVRPKHLLFFSFPLIFLFRLLLRFILSTVPTLSDFADHEFVGSTLKASSLGDSMELFGGIELGIAVRMVLFGKIVIGCFDFPLICKFVKTEDGYVIAGIQCALKLLTILATILVASFIFWIVSMAEILLSVDDLMGVLWFLDIESEVKHGSVLAVIKSRNSLKRQMESYTKSLKI